MPTALCCALLVSAASPAQSRGGDDGSIAAISNAITYQGVLKQGGVALNGTCDAQFSLWNAASAGTQIGTTQTFTNITVTGGQIAVAPDFGTLAFDGNDRWLQIAVRAPSGMGSYVTLSPRQKISAVPYALYSVGGNTGFTLPYSASMTSSTLDGLTITNLFGGGAGYSGRLGGPGYGIIGKHNVTGNLGYIGHADYGVFGIATAGTDIGVRGTHEASGNHGFSGTQFYGVEGHNGTANSGAGVLGKHTATGNFGELGDFVRGVRGYAVTANGLGVQGEHAPSGNYGTLGQSNAGVYAYGNSASAVFAQQGPSGNYALLAHPDYGVDGVVTSSEDTGVRGYHGPTGNYGSLGRFDYGVLGSGNIEATSGVFGINQFSGNWGALGRGDVGVFGNAVNTGGIGVYGQASGASGVAVQGVRGAAKGDLGGTAGVVGQYQSGGINNWATIGSGSTAINAYSAGSVAVLALSEGLNPCLQATNQSGGLAAKFVGNVSIFNGCLDGCLSDLAEAFPVIGMRAEYEPGDVMAISAEVDHASMRSSTPYDTCVLGVYATAPGVLLGGADAEMKYGEWVPVGVIGVVPTKVTIENGSIRRGDLLVTSSIPGHAMKGTDRERMLGAILGKALENFDGADGQTTGVIKVMVNCK